jgi:hypothetical protein
MTWEQLALSTVASAVISVDVSSTALFKPLREGLQHRPMLGKLVCCPWCLCHWVALTATAVYQSNPLYTFVIVGLAAVPIMLFEYLLEWLEVVHERV